MPFMGSMVPIQESRNKKWQTDLPKEHWLSFFYNLNEEGVTWGAPWVYQKVILYACGSFSWVPLLGIWGAISYAPLLVQRQFDSQLFIPRTQGLDQLEFTHGDPGSVRAAANITDAWKQLHYMNLHQVLPQVTPEYIEWRKRRVNSIVIPFPVPESPHGELPPRKDRDRYCQKRIC